MPPLPQVVGHVHQHTAGTARRVVVRVAGARLQNPHQRVHNFWWREELARLRSCIVGKFLDQVPVGAAKDVRRYSPVGRIVLVKMLDQSVNDFVGDQWFPRPVGCGLVPVHREDASQLVVRVGNRPHRPRESFADIHRNGLDVAPPSAVRNLVAMVAALAEDRLLPFGEAAALLTLKFCDRLVRLALPLVAEPLVEYQRQDVVLVILTCCLATQDIGGAPQVRFELLQGELYSIGDGEAAGVGLGSFPVGLGTEPS